MGGKRILLRGGELVLPDRIVKDGIVLVDGDSIAFAGEAVSFLKRYGVKAWAAGAMKLTRTLGLSEIFDLEKRIVVPALVEAHIHGAAGYDFETPGDSLGDTFDEDREFEDFERFVSFLSSKGVGIFVPTVVFEEGVIERITRIIRHYYSKESRVRRRIPGIYIEGPFISREKRGGIRDEYIVGFSEKVFERIYSLSSGLLKVMTFAPEVKGAEELIRVLVKRGVVPSLGHSDCSLAEIEDIVGKNPTDRGVIYNVTHLFNGMSGLSHKTPGLAHWALLEDSVYTELNCDETHVHPLALKLAFKLKPLEKIIMISDANSASGCDDSADFRRSPPLLRGRKLYVEGNGVYDMETKTLVGSRLLVKDSIKRVVDNYSISPVDVVKMASLNALRMLGISDRGELREGMKADISVFDQDFKECFLQIFEGNVTFQK